MRGRLVDLRMGDCPSAKAVGTAQAFTLSQFLAVYRGHRYSSRRHTRTTSCMYSSICTQSRAFGTRSSNGIKSMGTSRCAPPLASPTPGKRMIRISPGIRHAKTWAGMRSVHSGGYFRETLMATPPTNQVQPLRPCRATSNSAEPTLRPPLAVVADSSAIRAATATLATFLQFAGTHCPALRQSGICHRHKGVLTDQRLSSRDSRRPQFVPRDSRLQAAIQKPYCLDH